jgi:hypothetical protein
MSEPEAPAATRPAPPTQHAFAAALRDAALPVPTGLSAWNGSDPGVRFAVYRNNVVHSLVAVLADSFPVVRQLVGDEFFGAMARLYLVEHPPASALMHRYGAGLPAWIADFEPATALPYLADIARLEWSRLCAFHAADAEPVEIQALIALMQAPERLASAPLALHPSLAVVRSAHPVVSLWSAHQQDDATRDAQLSGLRMGSAEAALVFRDPSDDALVLELHHADAELTADIAAGVPLGAAQHGHPQADLTRVLTLLLRHGLVTGVGNPTCAPETSA